MYLSIISCAVIVVIDVRIVIWVIIGINVRIVTRIYSGIDILVDVGIFIVVVIVS